MEPIYMDHAATTPLRPEVRDAMAPYLSDVFGNPSSAHSFGRKAAVALSEARERLASVLGARPPEIYFVRGGTESDNLAVRGRAWAIRALGDVPVAAASAVEHSAVLESVEAVQTEGGEAHIIGVDPSGGLDEDVLDAVLALRPAVLSVMWVNNEVGTVLPVPAVAERARAAGVAMHTDAVQAVGKVPIRLDQVPVDLLTLTGHKVYGPRSTGMLFVREGTDLVPGLLGGGQERGLRPGTEDVAGAVGLSEAVALVVDELEAESARLERLRRQLESRLLERHPDLKIHGSEGPRAPHVSNLGVPGVDSTALVQALDLEGIAASSGSACHSGAAKTSHVLAALYGPDQVGGSVRFSLGHLTEEGGVQRCAEVAGSVIERLRHHAQAVDV
jgi:cysteine desulfurase